MAHRAAAFSSVSRVDESSVSSRTATDPGANPLRDTAGVPALLADGQRRTQIQPCVFSPGALAQSHLHLVPAVARRLVRHLPPGVDFGDLVADGYVGLVTASRAFSPGTGASFAAFARYRIRGAMLDGLRALDPRPRQIRREHRAMERTISGLANRLGRLPTEEEAVLASGLADEEWRIVRARLYAFATGYTLVIDRPREFTPDPDSLPSACADPETMAAKALLRVRIEEALRTISPRWCAVLAHYYGAGSTMEEIATLLGVSPSRVCQIHKRAILALRDHFAALDIRP